jgi:folate-binding Fe-S cluster repair protein YgfZ
MKEMYLLWTLALFARYLGGIATVGSFAPHRSIPHRSSSTVSSSSATTRPPSLLLPAATQQQAHHQEQTNNNNLASAYPDDIPASLSGEAIRSALRSGRCVGWNLDDDRRLQVGFVKVTGRGAINVTNGKVTTLVQKEVGSFQETCLLTTKGRMIDRLGIAVFDAETAYLVTSPGHAASRLCDYLDQFIFPLDQAQVSTIDSFTFTLASVQAADVQQCYTDYLIPQLKKLVRGGTTTTLFPALLPPSNECRFIALNDDNGSSSSLLILPVSGLSPSSGAGYTFAFFNDEQTIGRTVWHYLISNDCAEGPIEAGALEYESLRIEGGQPAFNHEMTGYDDETKKKKKKKEQSPTSSSSSSSNDDSSSSTNNSNSATAATTVTPASPLELHYGGDTLLLDLHKGCYLGQEGIASMVKNPKGPPRLLYHVVFDDTMNVYNDYQSQRGGKRTTRGRDDDDDDDDDDDGSGGSDNLTRLPVVGDRLYVLGSNEEIGCGTITSVAVPSSTGDPLIICLALVKRADSVLSQMKSKDLRLPRRTLSPIDGIIYPPPLDVLDGLEVIIGGTFTIGQLVMVPIRGRKRLYVNDVPDFVHNLPNDLRQDQVMVDYADRIVREPEDDDAMMDEDAADAAAAFELEMAVVEAEAAAAEAKRKAEKLQLLQQRAEEAMARRNNSNKTKPPPTAPGSTSGE